MKRVFGKSGIEVSSIGLGCWAIGGPFYSGDTPLGWGEVDDAESTRAIMAAIDSGVTFFDTADAYGTGHSERVLGKAVTGRRSSVVIATKFGNLFNEDTKQKSGGSAEPDYVRSACEASLKRLGTDYIDLYQLHLNDYDMTDALATRDALEGLVAAGKIRAYGWSTDSAERARLFGDGKSCTATQFEMNVLNDAPELVDVCEDMNLAAILRGPLAMGLLTGKYVPGRAVGDKDVRSNNFDWMRYFKDGKPNPEWASKLEAVREILTAGGRSLAQGAIAWLWARSSRCVPIPGIRTEKQAAENFSVLQQQPLTSEQMTQIESLIR